MTRSAIFAFALLGGLAGNSHADMPPRNLIAVRLELSSSAVVYFRGDPVKPEKRVIDAYVWRTTGDPEIDFSTPFTEGKIANARGIAEVSYHRVEDVFAISMPKKVVVFTGLGSRTVRARDIRRISPIAAPLNGRQLTTGEGVTLPSESASHLRSGPPYFFCQMGNEEMADRWIVSYNKKIGKSEIGDLCAPGDPDAAPPISKEDFDRIKALKKVFLMRFPWD